MTPELERAVKGYRQSVRLLQEIGRAGKGPGMAYHLHNGSIEFLTSDDSYKVKRIRRDPRVILLYR